MATRLSEEDAKRLLKHIDEDAPNVKAIQNIKAGRRVRMAMKAWEAKSKKILTHNALWIFCTTRTSP
ncbi:hypothetical protein GOP96_07175 [Vibrio cholerae]|nr:hypothetical protein [Vibrio cholerae]